MIGYGAFCDYFFTQKRYLDLAEKKQWVLAQDGGDYDYAVLGSSRAYGAFDMNMLDSLTGMSGINLASNGSGFKDNLLVLNLFLQNNTIDKLFLQVDLGSLNSKESFSNEFHAFTFLPYWEDSIVQKVLRNDIPALDNRLTSLIPQWRYFYFNKYFSPKEVLRRAELSDSQTDLYTEVKGGMQSTSIKNQKLNSEFQLYPQPHKVDSLDLSYLSEILSLSNSKNIQTTLFVAPRYQSDHKYLQSVMQQFPYPIVFPLEFDESDQNLFQDQGHLNEYGRFFYSNEFYKKILD
ncbi:hypothetical protein SAMN06265367_10339 [Algoriphagus winogradskyi]|uniref:Uncharacterized protein n=2 Tax=Algoriphagus winogradskyi TaxID=237017 RepID=A0ABY1NXZ9_9BACT|nr:hypothetical protein SAMN06265367_10339 [Algoriphagus winogradskyi]